MLARAVRAVDVWRQVVDVQQGTCVIKYAGPEAIGKGIAAAIKDTFQRDIQEVIVLGF